MIVTAGTLEESREALELAKSHPNLYSTVGVHPTRCNEFFGGSGSSSGGDPEAHVAALAAVLEEGRALGKVGVYLPAWGSTTVKGAFAAHPHNVIDMTPRETQVRTA